MPVFFYLHLLFCIPPQFPAGVFKRLKRSCDRQARPATDQTRPVTDRKQSCPEAVTIATGNIAIPGQVQDT